MSGHIGAVVLGLLILASLFVLLMVLGCARAAGRERPKPPRNDR